MPALTSNAHHASSTRPSPNGHPVPRSLLAARSSMSTALLCRRKKNQRATSASTSRACRLLSSSTSSPRNLKTMDNRHGHYQTLLTRLLILLEIVAFLPLHVALLLLRIFLIASIFILPLRLCTECWANDTGASERMRSSVAPGLTMHKERCFDRSSSPSKLE